MLMRKCFVHLFGVVIVLFAASAARAGNVDTFGIGAKATALGGAFSAYADDPFATYYNPAGLTQIDKPMLSLGTNLIHPSMNVYDYHVTGMTASDIGPRDFNGNSHTLVIPQIGFAMPINNSPYMVAGVGLYVPYGLDIIWGADPTSYPGAYNSYHSWYMREVITPSVACKISNSLSLGVGLSLGQSQAGADRLAFAPGTNLHNKLIMIDLTDDMNWSVNVGLLYKPIKCLSAGLTYRGKTSTHFDGTAKVAGLKDGDFVVPLVPVYNTTVNAKTEIDSPDQLQVGLRYLPIETLSLEVDVVWTRWSTIDGYTVSFDKKFLDAPLLGAMNPGSTSQYCPRHWDDTTQVKFGLEWQVSKMLALRGSYFYDPSPIPKTTLDLTWPDADRHTFATGFGLDLGKISIDGVVQYTITDGMRGINGESENLKTSYNGGGGSPKVSYTIDSHVWNGGITINYKF
jgi:long-chain fatty acid transport protein